MLGLSLAQAVLPVLALLLLGRIVALATGARPEAGAMGPVLLLLGAAGLLLLLAGAARAAAAFRADDLARRVADCVVGEIQGQAIRLDLEAFDTPRTLDLLQRARVDGPERPYRIVEGLVRGVQSSLGLLAYGGLVTGLDLRVAALVLLGSLPAVFIRRRFSRELRGWIRRRTPEEREASYIGAILSAPAFARDLRCLGFGGRLLGRHEELRARVRSERRGLAARHLLRELLGQLVSGVALVAAWALLLEGALAGRIPFAAAAVGAAALPRVGAALAGLLGSAGGLAENLDFLDDLERFLALEPRIRDPEDPRPAPWPLRRGVELRGVTFVYPEALRPALQDLEFGIGAGERVGLAGRNGSGKTTLLKLLARLHDPTQGAVSADGTDIRRFRVDAWRQGVGAHFLDSGRYEQSLRENLLLGSPGATEAELLDAVRSSGLGPLLARLPMGLDTRLGRQFEGGVALSLGEWQRVALARVLLRRPGLLLLDEPAGALDPEAETDLIAKVLALPSDRAVVYASHRLQALRPFDRILVLDEGRLVESGRFEDLVRQGGLFAALLREGSGRSAAEGPFSAPAPRG
jgi:ATP-binding cassette subfamily B protein